MSATLYPKISLEEWCETYGLEPITVNCKGCGKEFSTTVPVAFQHWRGIETPHHECKYNSAVVVSVDPTENAEWLSMFSLSSKKKQ